MLKLEMTTQPLFELELGGTTLVLGQNMIHDVEDQVLCDRVTILTIFLQPVKSLVISR